MSIQRTCIITLASLFTMVIATGLAAAEKDAKINAGKVGIKRSEDKFKKRLDDHVNTELKCSVLSGAVGQYRLSPVAGVKGQLVGCAAPKPLCFMANEKLAEGRKSFITSLNSRFGSTEDVNQDLPTVPECALPTKKLNLTLNVDVDQLATDVKAYVDFKFDAKYINSQKVSFGANNAFPKLNGTTYPRANGEVITAYVNYDRSFSFKCKVVVDTLTTDVNVDLNLDYAETNVHYCEATFVIADQNMPEKIDCPKS
jgi:hypothetical protein